MKKLGIALVSIFLLQILWSSQIGKVGGNPPLPFGHNQVLRIQTDSDIELSRWLTANSIFSVYREQPSQLYSTWDATNGKLLSNGFIAENNGNASEFAYIQNQILMIGFKESKGILYFINTLNGEANQLEDQTYTGFDYNDSASLLALSYISLDLTEGGTISIFDPLQQEMVQMLPIQEGNPFAPKWNHDGKYISFIFRDRNGRDNFQILDAHDLTVINTWVSDVAWSSYDWSPSENRIAFMAGSCPAWACGLVIWDITQPSSHLIGTANLTIPLSISWSFDGQYIAVAGKPINDVSNMSGEIQIWDAITEKMIFRKTLSVEIIDMDWHPSELKLLFSDKAGVITVWEVVAP